MTWAPPPAEEIESQLDLHLNLKFSWTLPHNKEICVKGDFQLAVALQYTTHIHAVVACTDLLGPNLEYSGATLGRVKGRVFREKLSTQW